MLSACCVIMFLSVGCHKKEPPPPPPPVPVAIIPAEKGQVPRETAIIGSVKAFASVDLVARVSGYLVERNFREGQFVKKGTRLFRIEPYQYEAAVKVAAGNLGVAVSSQKNAEITMKRQKELVERRATAVQTYDDALAAKIEADANVEAMQGALEQARLNLSYTDVVAPFDGWMGLIKYDVGNLVGPSSGVLTNIVDQSRVLVQFSPADTELRALGEHLGSETQFAGLLVFLFFEGGEAYPEPGIIVRSDNRIDPDTGTATLQAIFRNPEGKLAPGQFVTLKIQTRTRDELLLVPRLAIQSDQAGDYVWVAGADNKAQRHDLVITREFDHFAAVSQGVAAGDRIVMDNLAKMRIGTHVAVHESTMMKDKFAALTSAAAVKVPAINLEDTYLHQSDTGGQLFGGEIKAGSKAEGEKLGQEFQTPPLKESHAMDPEQFLTPSQKGPDIVEPTGPQAPQQKKTGAAVPEKK